MTEYSEPLTTRSRKKNPGNCSEGMKVPGLLAGCPQGQDPAERVSWFQHASGSQPLFDLMSYPLALRKNGVNIYLSRPPLRHEGQGCLPLFPQRLSLRSLPESRILFPLGA